MMDTFDTSQRRHLRRLQRERHMDEMRKVAAAPLVMYYVDQELHFDAMPREDAEDSSTTSWDTNSQSTASTPVRKFLVKEDEEDGENVIVVDEEGRRRRRRRSSLLGRWYGEDDDDAVAVPMPYSESESRGRRKKKKKKSEEEEESVAKRMWNQFRSGNFGVSEGEGREDTFVGGNSLEYDDVELNKQRQDEVGTGESGSGALKMWMKFRSGHLGAAHESDDEGLEEYELNLKPNAMEDDDEDIESERRKMICYFVAFLMTLIALVFSVIDLRFQNGGSNLILNAAKGGKTGSVTTTAPTAAPPTFPPTLVSTVKPKVPPPSTPPRDTDTSKPNTTSPTSNNTSSFDNKEETASPPNPTLDLTPEASKIFDRSEEILSIIIDASATPISTLSNTSSPQFKAVEWLSRTDLFPRDKILNPKLEKRLMLERYALTVLYFSTNGKRWMNDAGWLDNFGWSVCEWQGVHCGEVDDVEKMSLSEFGVDGRNDTKMVKALFVEKVGEYRFVQKINLMDNHLYGTIPDELKVLKDLKHLYLSNNFLSSRVPKALSYLDKLEKVYLDDNELTGLIPQSLGALQKLESLKLHSNDLVGTMPKSVCDLTTRPNPVLGEVTSDCRLVNLEREVTCPCCTRCY